MDNLPRRFSNRSFNLNYPEVLPAANYMWRQLLNLAQIVGMSIADVEELSIFREFNYCL